MTLLRTATDCEEREEMQRGRSLESSGSSLESSQRAKRVSIRSSISSTSESDFANDDDDDSAIFIFSVIPLFTTKLKTLKYELGIVATCALRLLWTRTSLYSLPLLQVTPRPNSGQNSNLANLNTRLQVILRPSLPKKKKILFF